MLPSIFTVYTAYIALNSKQNLETTTDKDNESSINMVTSDYDHTTLITSTIRLKPMYREGEKEKMKMGNWIELLIGIWCSRAANPFIIDNRIW